MLMKYLTIVNVRQASKWLKNKNIKFLNGFPLIIIKKSSIND